MNAARVDLILGLSDKNELPKNELKAVKDKSKWKKYRALVWEITEAQPLKKLPNFEKRGFNEYHLDHKVSIWYGFKNHIDPKVIGSIDNLEFIPAKQNALKNTRCNFKGFKGTQTVIFV